MRQVAREMGIIELRRRKRAENDYARFRRRLERQRVRNDSAGVQVGRDRSEEKWEELERVWSTEVEDNLEAEDNKVKVTRCTEDK